MSVRQLTAGQFHHIVKEYVISPLLYNLQVNLRQRRAA